MKFLHKHLKKLKPVKKNEAPTQDGLSYNEKTQDEVMKKKTKKRLWLKIVLAVVAVVFAIAAVGLYITYKSVDKVIQKNAGPTAQGLKTQNIAPQKLKGEGDGRVNILLLGVGDQTHEGATLSDTIIVASYDPVSEDIAMLSIPRDLYVRIPGFGFARINEAHAYGEMQKKGNGPEVTKQTVSQVLNIPIHYFVKADFSALKQAVDIVGGVDINVKKPLSDPDYPCERAGDRCAYSISAGLQHMNGSAALKYARCRKGNCGDDYGRAERQQEVILALQQKAKNQNILSTTTKLPEILTAIGDNVRTDLQLGELEKIASIAKKLNLQNLNTHVLDTNKNFLVKNSSIGAASVVIPSLGIGNYSAIQNYARTIFVDGYIKKEAAKIHVASATKAQARFNLAVSELKSYNYNVVSQNPSPGPIVAKTQIVDYTNGAKPYTIEFLEKRFGVTATKATKDPSQPAITADIVITIGTNY